MSGNGPVTPKNALDLGAFIHNTFVATKEVVAEEIREVATGKNTLGTTQAAPTVVKAVEAVAQVVQPFSPLVQDFCPVINNATNATWVAPIVEVAKNASNASNALVAVKPVVAEAAESVGTSYLNYGLGLVGSALGLYGLRKLYNSRKQAQQVMQPQAAVIISDSAEILEAFPQLAQSPLVKAFLEGLTAEQAQALKNLAALSKDMFANIAKMTPEQQLISLQTAVAPVAIDPTAALLTEVFAANMAGIGGTQAASSKKAAAPAPAPVAQTLAQTIMVSPEAKQILAVIEAHPQSKAVLDTMSKEAVEGLNRNSSAATLKAMQGMNGATLAAVLERAKAKYAPKAEETKVNANRPQ